MSNNLQRAFNLLDQNDFSNAIEIAKNALEDGSVEPLKAGAFAERLRAVGKYGDSIKFFDYVLEKDPTNADILIGKTKALYDQDDKLKAAHAIEPLATIAKGNNDLEIKLLNTYAYIRSFHLAEEMAERIIKRDPNWFPIRQRLAQLYLDRGHFVQAKNTLDSILELHSLESQEWAFVARSYAKVRDLKSALEASQKAISLASPPALEEHFARAEILILLNKFKDAKQEIDTIRAHVDRLDDLIRSAELYFASKDERSAKEFALIINDKISNIKIPVNVATRVALVFYALQENEFCRMILAKIAIDDISNFYVLRSFHSACFEMKAYDLAEKSARHALKMSPYDLYFKEQVLKLRMLMSQSVETSQRRQISFWSRLFIRHDR